MAFSSSLVLEVESGASDSNGGGFDPGLASIAPMTDGAPTNANTATPTWPHTASYTFVAGDVNHWLYVKAGTSSTPGWYKITAVDGSGNATLDAAIGHAVLAAGTPNTVAGCATVASPTTQTWLIDYSQVTGGTALTHLTIDGTTNTKFNCSDITIGKNLIGNLINVTGGTGFTVQRIGIVSTSGTTATADKSLGTLSSSGGTGTLGGAFASPALPLSVALSSNMVFVKSGAYSISSSSTNAANGVIVVSQTALRLEGYGSVRGDLGTPPVLTASGISSVSLVSATGSSSHVIRNLTADGAGLSTIRCFNLGAGTGYLLFAKNATNSGINGAVSILELCRATGCSSAGAGINGTGIWTDCESYSNTVSGFAPGGNSTLISCLSYANSGASSDGFAPSNSGPGYVNCDAYNNGRDGFRLTPGLATAINCIAEGNSGNGFNVTQGGSMLISCAAYNNGTNFTVTGANAMNINPVTGTASFFVAASSGNFALNANAGGGALVRAAGIPGATPDGLSTGYLDIGAIQSPPLWPPARAFTAGSMN